jgi:uncharacterized membrane protein
MSCTGATGYQAMFDAAWQALQNQQFIEAFTCTFADAAGGLVVVGTLFWFAISAMSYIRSGGSFAMPIIFTLIFGGAVLGQVASPVLGMAAVLLLGGFGGLVVLFARRATSP